ncbi:receptor-like protein kinase [Carex littledalei]|uniref:Receptor-like protein kinase n=1 Tax=Carex littledalei TaxID=544730 RepID=A0A833QL58_9POAL|nr:receptor-like protein kinase [Carex littledalei]
MAGGLLTSSVLKQYISYLALFLLHISTITYAIPPPSVKFEPRDVYMISCGAPGATQLDDGRTFRSDPDTASYLSTSTNIKISADNPPHASTGPLAPIYVSARVFTDQSTYSFYLAQPGRHWVRLHFLPLPNSNYNLSSATFSVNADSIVLLHGFSLPAIPPSPVIKEYLITTQSNTMKLSFSPLKGSVAFVNAIEVVSAPPNLVPNTTATAGTTTNNQIDLSGNALQVVYRLNMGGPLITPANDTLYRFWQPDTTFLTLPEAAVAAWVPVNTIKYPDDGSMSPLIAPPTVYSSAQQMAQSNTSNARFNISWKIPAEPGFSYLIRLHFCDIVSKALNNLYFNVYLNGLMGVSSLDLSSLTMGLAVTYYRDFVLDSSSISNSTILVQVGPTSTSSGDPNAILNGLEMMKISNLANSLDGFYAAKPKNNSKTKMIISAIGLAMAAVAMALVFMMFCRRRCEKPGWERKSSFSSWLMPLNASQSTSSFLSGYSKSSRSRFGSTQSKSGFSGIFMSGTYAVSRVFTFSEIQKATKNFDEKAVIGVGGFGKVYLGELVDGTKLAIKRGNSSSDQGMHEFLTEIELLSKLRHRHLVSLIGCCDEKNEMILVYEYMSKGTVRDHLYVGNGGGETGMPLLNWNKRLEICIGAAKGLHYLHTGAAQGIIHRDIKTTNILLDENLVAKVSDFGLSKTAPSLEQTHVSTAVKGSFGYLDPEYFRRQQLTDKSDVYSFGVVLFEILCARPAINPALPRDQVNLAEWALQWKRKGQLEKIIDPNIAGTINPDSLIKFVDAAEKCLADYGVDRPTMGDVLWKLESALQLQVASTPVAESSGSGGAMDMPLKKTTSQKSGLTGFDSFNDRSGTQIPPPLDQGR